MKTNVDSSTKGETANLIHKTPSNDGRKCIIQGLFCLLGLISVLCVLFYNLTARGVAPEKFRQGAGLRWGIAGCGRIANDFALTLKENGLTLVSVAAGSNYLPDNEEMVEQQRRASMFANKFGARNAYSSYILLSLDSDVDIVYIATTNNLHHEVALIMLEAKKHVLLEKPTAMNSLQTIDIINTARRNDVFFTTNYWTREFPMFKLAQRLVHEEALIGDIVALRADFGFQIVQNSSDAYFKRFFDPRLGGGVVLDIGGYQVQYATEFFSKAYKNQSLNVKSFGQLSNRVDQGVVRGVDLDVSYLLQWQGTRQTATFGLSFLRASPFDVHILGSKGYIHIHEAALCPTKISVREYKDARTQYADQMPIPCCSQESVSNKDYHSGLPESKGLRYYPCTSGFIYMIKEIENCLSENSTFCRNLPSLSNDEQVLISKFSDRIIESSYEYTRGKDPSTINVKVPAAVADV